MDVQLARMEGVLNQVRDGQKRIEDDHRDMKVRLNGHSDRLSVLERKNAEEAGAQGAREAVQRAVGTAVKLVWGILGVTIIGVLALIGMYTANRGH